MKMKKLIDRCLYAYARLLDWASALIERLTGRRTFVYAPCVGGELAFTANAPYVVTFACDDGNVVQVEHEDDVLTAFERCARVLDLSGRHEAAADVREIITQAEEGAER